MLGVLTAFHVLVCIGLIIVVLLQTGKGTGLASVFGGGGGESVFGGKGFGSVLAKAMTCDTITHRLMMRKSNRTFRKASFIVDSWFSK